MSGFKVKLKTLRIISEEISLYGGDLRKYYKEMTETHKNLNHYSSFMNHVDRNMIKVEENILEIAADIEKFAKVLDSIVELYIKAEQEATGKELFEDVKLPSSEEGFPNVFEYIWGTVKNKLINIGIIKPEKQSREDEKEVKLYQQQEMDSYMKNYLKEFRKNKRYTEETWKSASADERKKILNEYSQEIAKVMGIPMEPIHYMYMEPDEAGRTLFGSACCGFDYIRVNQWCVENKSFQEIIDTIEHESRHLYQYKVCENPEKYVVSNETIDAWQKNSRDYKTTYDFIEEGMEGEKAQKAYEDQAIEVDARGFEK